jgi:UPF0176 protein
MIDHIAFYRFVALDQPEVTAATLEELAADLLGTILVAQEGINGMLAGEPAAIDAFIDGLCGDERLMGAFTDIVIKRTDCGTTQPFRKRKIRVKVEIVPLGVDIDAPSRVADIAARDVPPQEWRELIRRSDVVVIDNRNSFEYRTGHFEGAVDPGVDQFRQFTSYVQAHADEWRESGTKVAMYCTGGIRCEKASPWMQDLGLDVYQLEGGILNYFAQMPDADADWHGECFIFDNRVTLDTNLCETPTRREDIDE